MKRRFLRPVRPNERGITRDVRTAELLEIRQAFEHRLARGAGPDRDDKERLRKPSGRFRWGNDCDAVLDDALPLRIAIAESPQRHPTALQSPPAQPPQTSCAKHHHGSVTTAQLLPKRLALTLRRRREGLGQQTLNLYCICFDYRVGHNFSCP
jgi:hypothetical protein